MKATRLLTISVIFLVFCTFAFAQEHFKIHFIDMGEGDAIFIQAPNENILVDTGGLLSGYKLVDYLQKNKVKEINYLIITHQHIDHIGGLFFIIPQFRVKQIFDNGQKLDKNDDILRWYSYLLRLNPGYHCLKQNDKLKLADGLTLNILWPKESESGSFNENSLVIKLTYQDFSCLLTGDINAATEHKLLGTDLNLKSRILKVGHHGYSDVTSQEFVDAVSPELAIITASKAQKLPLGPTLQTLRKKGIKVLRTDNSGNVLIVVDKLGDFSVMTEEPVSN